jgi:hypothetical protein
MADRHAVIESRQTRRHDRCGISLHQHNVGPLSFQDGMKPLQNQGRQSTQFLIGPHHIKIVVHWNSKPAQDGLQQVAVLRGNADASLELISTSPQLPNHGGELDGFGTRAQNDEDVKTFSGHQREFSILDFGLKGPPVSCLLREGGTKRGMVFTRNGLIKDLYHGEIPEHLLSLHQPFEDGWHCHSQTKL